MQHEVFRCRQKGSQIKGREILGLEASFYLDDLFELWLDLLRPVQGVEFLASDAIGFAGSGLAIPHRHPGAQRARSSKSGSTVRLEARYSDEELYLASNRFLKFRNFS
jgi:hypothetical protein